MIKKKIARTQPDSPQTSSSIGLDSQTLQILMKEYDVLSDMYNQAVHNGEVMFNYYLTLMTAVYGGIALVIQPSSGVYMPKTTISILLMLFSIIGSFYLSSFSTNFAHATRYSRGINEIRRFIIKHNGGHLPLIYNNFVVAKNEDKTSKTIFFLSLFIPVNTYQLFATTMNSLSWALAISTIYYSYTNMNIVEIIWRGAFAFIITYLIYNIYARLIYHVTISNANIAIGH